MSKLKEFRESRLMTLEMLSERSGLAISTIWALEQGRYKAQLSTIGKLAAALNVNVKELMYLRYQNNGAATK